MSATTALGIVVIAFGALGIAIVAGMFLWGAREDGRDQERTNARLARAVRSRRRDLR
jgi:uncharacterized iron-regulated membrane protein